MKLRFFASLKDYFGEEMNADHVGILTVNDLLAFLINTKPGLEDLLKKCRFAVDLSFVGYEASLEGISEVLIMPPSSGG